MIITTKDVNEIKVVEFDGEFDTTASPAAESQLNQLREQGVRKILVDLEKMSSEKTEKISALVLQGVIL